MSNKLTIKTYNIDYSFIIKNYLDKELWQKEWTLFVYKQYVFTINLYEIDVKNDAIRFEVHMKSPGYTNNYYFTYFRQQSNLEILKKQINGTVFTLMELCERSLIREEDGYKTIQEASADEENMLTEIAEEFLDDNGVTNKEIREVYIDNYVSNNTKTASYLSNYLDGREYCVLSDLYLVYTKLSDDENRYNRVLSKIKNNVNYMDVLAEANAYINKLNNEEEQEELKTEFRECLEAI